GSGVDAKKRIILAAYGRPARMPRRSVCRDAAGQSGRRLRCARRLVELVDGEPSRRIAADASNPVSDEMAAHRRRDEKAMRSVATKRRDRPQRTIAVDAFGDDAHFEGARELDDDSHDLSVLFVRRRRRYEPLVDLDLGRRDFLQIAERRIALPEIVDGETDTEIADSLETRRRDCIARHEALLGQLDDEL